MLEGTPIGDATQDAHTGPVPPPASDGHVICQFCDCRLLRDGSVLKTSARARALQKSEEIIDELKRDNAELRRQLAVPAPAKRGFTVRL